MNVVKESDNTFSIKNLDEEDLDSFVTMIKSSCIIERRIFSPLIKQIVKIKENEK